MTAFWCERDAKPKLGIACRSLPEIKTYAPMPEFDTLELSIAGLAKNGFELYSIDRNEKYSPHLKNAEILKNILGGKPYQVHMPYEGNYLLPGERKFFHARRDDHKALTSRQRVVAEIFRITGNKGICVWHLAALKVKKQKIATLENAYEIASILYSELDTCVLLEKWPTQITFENYLAPKEDYEILGYEPEHFWKLLGKTKRIGITIDTGHGNLAPEDFHFQMLMGTGFPVCSVHFHGNSGKFDPKSWKDDEHVFATKDNIRGYNRWISLFKRSGLPVILEINKEKYKPEEIQDYTRKLRFELAI